MDQTQSPLFSILIAMYNNGRYFKECYDSILGQSYENWEVIIVDDCSTDNSLEIMRTIIAEDGRFKILRNETNSKCGATKRRCVELSSGEFFGFLDSDDFLEPHALELSVKALLANKEAALSYSNHYRFNDGDISNRQGQKKYSSIHSESIISFTNGFESLPFHFVAFRRSLYDKTAGLDSMFTRGVDFDLFAKMEEVGSFVFIDDCLYNYRVHNNNISLGLNLFNSIIWIIVAIYEACKRRGDPNFEKYASNFLRIHFSPSLQKYIVVGRVICNPSLIIGITKKRLKNIFNFYNH